MCRSVPWFWLVGTLAATTLTGCCCCCCCDCRQSREPPLARTCSCRKPAAPAPACRQVQEPTTGTAVVEAPIVPAVPDPAPATGPILPPISSGPASGTPSPGARWLPSPSEEHRTLVGKLEPGAERGTWFLRYEPDLGNNLRGDAIQLIASQPLSGCRAGLEVRVEGYLTPYRTEMAFQVERITRVPPG